MKLACFTFRQQPEVSAIVFPVVKKRVWPTFMFNDPVADACWGHLEEDFPDFQFVLRDMDADGTIAAVGHTIPFQWEGELPDDGWDGVFAKAIDDLKTGRTPNQITALEAVIAPEYQGKGFSRVVINQMRHIAQEHGFATLVAPVRPSWKARYPLTPIEHYVRWKHDDGAASFDPWLRTHERMGASMVKIASHSMRIPGTVGQWETWVGMRFPESGRYVIPGALNPIEIDCNKIEGVYVEPNVWMRHEICSK